MYVMVFLYCKPSPSFLVLFSRIAGFPVILVRCYFSLVEDLSDSSSVASYGQRCRFLLHLGRFFDRIVQLDSSIQPSRDCQLKNFAPTKGLCSKRQLSNLFTVANSQYQLS